MNPLLNILREQVGECTKCSLAGEGRQCVVFGSGQDTRPLVMAIGEGPGAEEDNCGIPFSGPAGQLLHKMFQSIGLDMEKDVYLDNVVKCRPYQNHKPLKQEAETCVDHVKIQIALIKPSVLVMVGSTATEYVLGVKDAMKNLAGTWHDYQGIPATIIYHPAYILRLAQDPVVQTTKKRETWNHLLSLKKFLNETQTKSSSPTVEAISPTMP